MKGSSKRKGAFLNVVGFVLSMNRLVDIVVSPQDSTYKCMFVDAKSSVTTLNLRAQKPGTQTKDMQLAMLDVKSARYWCEKSRATLLVLSFELFSHSRAHPFFFDVPCAKGCAKHKRSVVILLPAELTSRFCRALQYVNTLAEKYGFRLLLASGSSGANWRDCVALLSVLTYRR